VSSPAPTEPVPPTAPTEPVRLTRPALAWRSLALAAGTLLVTYGTLFGNDVDWPFAPMAQFAFRVGRDDAIHSTFLQARTRTGKVITVPITPTNLGIARAEIEGQQPAIIREPRLLGDLAGAYARLHPDRPPLTQLWLRDRVTVLKNGRAAGVHVDTLVGWPAP
jgi:hypothetical protein